MKYESKKKAIILRQSGNSIGEIAEMLHVAKSSVSLWVRNVKLTDVQRYSLNRKGFSVDAIEKRREVRLLNEQNKRESVMETAGRDLKLLPKSGLKLIGCMLYWAEGGKTHRGSVRVSNGDPDLIKVMMRFFREVCFVKEGKFKGHIHIHPHLDVEKAEAYWSGVTGIPRKQFFKTYSKTNIASKNKKDSLPYGTFDIYVCDTMLFLKIMGWIRKIKTIILER